MAVVADFQLFILYVPHKTWFQEYYQGCVFYYTLIVPVQPLHKSKIKDWLTKPVAGN